LANRATRFLEQDGLTPPVPPESRVSTIYVIIVIYCILDR